MAEVWDEGRVIDIAALYVQKSGVYFGLDNVDPWDEARDARAYAGPYPVIAHPPCQRWGRYWSGGPNPRQPRKKMGDDAGCFEAALRDVRKWGGVIEHPEATHAWRVFDLSAPEWLGGWSHADCLGGWTCCVSQGHYGHRARKMTWLYVFGLTYSELPKLKWGPAKNCVRMEDSHSSLSRELARGKANNGINERLSTRERAKTPLPFRDLLIEIAGRCDPSKAVALDRQLELIFE